MVQIIADSTCDLSQDLLEKYNVKILPLMINLEDDSFKDGLEFRQTKYTNGQIK